jgi:hypothetical protein
MFVAISSAPLVVLMGPSGAQMTPSVGGGPLHSPTTHTHMDVGCLNSLTALALPLVDYMRQLINFEHRDRLTGLPLWSQICDQLNY